MKRLFAAIAISLSLVSFALAQSGPVNIVPRPENIGSTHEGPFLLDRQVEIVSKNKATTDALNDYLRSNLGFSLPVKSAETGKKRKIVFQDTKFSGPNEAYFLNVFSDRIDIRADSTAGHFYALQSLFQLLSNRNGRWAVTSVRIA